MDVTFLESLWIAVYGQSFGRIRLETAGYGSSVTDAQVGVRAAAIADAACAALPATTVTAQRTAIAATKTA